MYQQIDGIAMGSPLGAVMVNIFVGFQEEKLFETKNKLLYYVRYVDGTFMFSSRAESRRFFHSINQLHPVLKFTCEFENNNCLSFLGVLVEHTN